MRFDISWYNIIFHEMQAALEIRSSTNFHTDGNISGLYLDCHFDLQKIRCTFPREYSSAYNHFIAKYGKSYFGSTF